MSSHHFLQRSCPLCGETATREEVHSRHRAETQSFDSLRPFWSGLFKEKRFFTYRRCIGCGLLYNPVYFSNRQIGELYAHMAPNMDAVETHTVAATQRGYFERAISQVEPGGDYLEIGPDTGHIAAQAAQTGSFGHFWLFEPNHSVHRALRDALGGQPITLHAEMGDLSAVPDRTIGLAVLIHVLDHLLDPLAMLAEIRAKLRPGGVVMLVTHNEKSLLRRAIGVRWPPFCLQHPELYNPETMRSMLARAGFDGIGVERSRNYFPADFLARQAAWAVGLKLKRVPLPSVAVGLRLGNMLTLAVAPRQAASRTFRQEEIA